MEEFRLVNSLSIWSWLVLTLIVILTVIILFEGISYYRWLEIIPDWETPDAPYVKGELKRYATTAYGAEMTGPFVLPNGNPVFSLQHPSQHNKPPFHMGGVVVAQGFDIFNESFGGLEPPRTVSEQKRVRLAAGYPDLVIREGQNLGEDEDLGVPTTPEGLNLTFFEGPRDRSFGHMPDMNQFIPTEEQESVGYLFTNFETSPGNITRVPLQLKNGIWRADQKNALNLVNHKRFRAIGGTRINCYGDLSPWGTPLSAEEDYAHPYVSGTHTVSEIVEEESDGGYYAASHFWNRPNAHTVQDAVNNYFWFSSWKAQATSALRGIELLAYHLGAKPVDLGGDPLTPIEGEAFPNKYRYGHLVEIKNPSNSDWRPVKYYVMGRFAPESPDIMADKKTVYLTSDGSFKGVYKFVADQPIPRYSDPLDVSGAIYVASIEGPVSGPPAHETLDVNWIELGSASNREVLDWIEEYDHVDQLNYLNLATRSDNPDRVSEDASLKEKLEAADRYVIENGNPAYVTPEEISEWASQYEQNGPSGVDEDLRRVPFLETRAAAKEAGGTIEWRKGEGIDSRTGKPGDFVYIGFSEVDAKGMSDDRGDLRMERVEGGIVYRARVEDDFNLEELEPVVVGPDAWDSAEVADNALVNVDNVQVIEDGRVLLFEDAEQLGRSYPNDNFWIYTPPEGRIF